MGLTVSTDPLVGWSFLVNLVKLRLIRSNFVGGFGSAGRKNISTDEAEVLNELAELGVGDEEGDENAKVCGG